jgi:hypothetical protein
MVTELHYYRGAERPDIRLWLQDDDKSLVDLSSGYTFRFTLGAAGAAPAFAKTTGITGAAGSGTAPDGTPNATITFAPGETDTMSPGRTVWWLRATTGGLDRYWSGPFVVREPGQ